MEQKQARKKERRDITIEAIYSTYKPYYKPYTEWFALLQLQNAAGIGCEFLGRTHDISEGVRGDERTMNHTEPPLDPEALTLNPLPPRENSCSSLRRPH